MRHVALAGDEIELAIAIQVDHGHGVRLRLRIVDHMFLPFSAA
jgi:hypothetical protein